MATQTQRQVRPFRLPALLAAVYFAEGLVSAMFGLSFLYLTEIGIEGGRLGVIIFIALTPLFFKPLTGLICDAISPIGMGRRRDWLLIGLVAQAIGFVVLALWTESRPVNLYLTGMTIVVVALIFYDACIDGYAIEKSDKRSFGKIQSWMTGGRYLSILMTPLVATAIASNIGWSSAFLLMAVLSVLPLVLLGFVDESGKEIRRYFVPKIREYVNVRNLLICGAGFGAMLGTSGTEEVYLGYFRDEVNVPLQYVGAFGTIFGIGVISGALLTPFAANWLKLTIQMQNHIAFVGVVFTTLLMVFAGTAVTATIAAGLFGVVMGIIHVTVFAYGMHVAVEGSEATGFSIFSFFLVCGTVLAMTVAPYFVEELGYRYAICLSIVGPVVGILCVVLIGKTESVARNANL